MRLLVVGGIALFALAAFSSRPAARAHGPLAYDAYVWQREWRRDVVDAVARAHDAALPLVVLAAEVRWRGALPVATPVAWDATAATKRPLGLALRIAPRAGSLADVRTIDAVTRIAVETVGRARDAGIVATELQLDFDAGTRQLAEYASWVRSIRAAVAPVPVTVTALPAWLRSGSVHAVIDAADGWVLQVHGLARPKDAAAPFSVCDPAVAREAVDAAATLGRPFRVALPTYGYRLLFDRAERFIGFAAESPADIAPGSGSAREVRPDATAMAALVREWQASRPAELAGVTWYRLPVDGDARAWTWETLHAVMSGREPVTRFTAEVATPAPGLVELALRNDGETADVPALAFRVPAAESARARDALAGFRWDADGERLRSEDGTVPRLRPGERRIVAWLRFDEPKEVRVDVDASR